MKIMLPDCTGGTGGGGVDVVVLPPPPPPPHAVKAKKQSKNRGEFSRMAGNLIKIKQLF
jgi:hypothetical protein